MNYFAKEGTLPQMRETVTDFGKSTRIPVLSTNIPRREKQSGTAGVNFCEMNIPQEVEISVFPFAVMFPVC